MRELVNATVVHVVHVRHIGVQLTVLAHIMLVLSVKPEVSAPYIKVMQNPRVEVNDSSALRKNTQHTHTRLHFLSDTTVRAVVRGTTLGHYLGFPTYLAHGVPP
jgi:hypothetical protein